MCGDPTGTCRAASCNAGECGAGSDCASYSMPACPGCLQGFACQSGADECFSDSDCAGDASATVGSCSLTTRTFTSARGCTLVGGGSCCGIGRPFLVEGEARLAPAVGRSDWHGETEPAVATMPVGVRARLAQHWTDSARMEHASVAAFARVVLQLLALGAPHDLIADAERAMADEIRHARLAFGLAGAYAGTPLGPGPIALDRCLDEGGVGALVATSFVEGCVGETIAALEALEAAEQARDPAIRAVLETVAKDEARHAEHAWRTVHWALHAFGESAGEPLRAALARAQAEAEAPDGRDGDPDAWLAHGVLNEGLSATIRRAALRGLVVPLAAALLRDHDPIALRDHHPIATRMY